MPKRILFVCTGNICRSPTADGVARTLAARAGRAGDFEFDSAGTENYHAGEAPDRRAQRRARLRGYDLSGLTARQLVARDFEAFDLILAMDREHFCQLEGVCPPALRHKLQLFLSYADDPHGMDVPDPYYGSDADFDHVLDLCESVIPKLLADD